MENSYDSVLMGYCEAPRKNEQGEITSWSFSLNREQLADLSKYQTQKGNVNFTLFFSKKGQALCRVYDPNSTAAKTRTVQRTEEVDPFG
tara:strand:- start:23417 stop:23683 length:267 start_codon:yes stop_codon:yes gene_type:complete